MSKTNSYETPDEKTQKLLKGIEGDLGSNGTTWDRLAEAWRNRREKANGG